MESPDKDVVKKKFSLSFSQNKLQNSLKALENDYNNQESDDRDSPSPPPSTDHFLNIVPKPTLLRKQQAKQRLKAFSIQKAVLPAIPLVKKTKANKPILVTKESYTGDGVKIKETVTSSRPRKLVSKSESKAKETLHEIQELSKADAKMDALINYGRKQWEKDKVLDIHEDDTKAKLQELQSRWGIDYKGILKVEKHKLNAENFRGKYPDSWTELKANNLTLDGIKKIYLRSKSRSEDKRTHNDAIRMLNIELPSVNLSPFKYKTASGADEYVHPQLLRYTKHSPSIPYSINPQCEFYFNRKQILDTVPTRRKESIQKIIDLSAQKPLLLPASPLKIRKWYPKSELFLNQYSLDDPIIVPAAENECELLDNSLGLSILQTYVDEDDKSDAEEDNTKKTDCSYTTQDLPEMVYEEITQDEEITDERKKSKKTDKKEKMKLKKLKKIKLRLEKKKIREKKSKKKGKKKKKRKDSTSSSSEYSSSEDEDDRKSRKKKKKSKSKTNSSDEKRSRSNSKETRKKRKRGNSKNEENSNKTKDSRDGNISSLMDEFPLIKKQFFKEDKKHKDRKLNKSREEENVKEFKKIDDKERKHDRRSEKGRFDDRRIGNDKSENLIPTKTIIDPELFSKDFLNKRTRKNEKEEIEKSTSKSRDKNKEIDVMEAKSSKSEDKLKYDDIQSDEDSNFCSKIDSQRSKSKTSFTEIVTFDDKSRNSPFGKERQYEDRSRSRDTFKEDDHRSRELLSRSHNSTPRDTRRGYSKERDTSRRDDRQESDSKRGFKFGKGEECSEEMDEHHFKDSRERENSIKLDKTSRSYERRSGDKELSMKSAKHESEDRNSSVKSAKRFSKDRDFGNTSSNMHRSSQNDEPSDKYSSRSKSIEHNSRESRNWDKRTRSKDTDEKIASKSGDDKNKIVSTNKDSTPIDKDSKHRSITKENISASKVLETDSRKGDDAKTEDKRKSRVYISFENSPKDSKKTKNKDTSPKYRDVAEKSKSVERGPLPKRTRSNSSDKTHSKYEKIEKSSKDFRSKEWASKYDEVPYPKHNQDSISKGRDVRLIANLEDQKHEHILKSRSEHNFNKTLVEGNTKQEVSSKDFQFGEGSSSKDSEKNKGRVSRDREIHKNRSRSKSMESLKYEKKTRRSSSEREIHLNKSRSIANEDSNVKLAEDNKRKPFRSKGMLKSYDDVTPKDRNQVGRRKIKKETTDDRELGTPDTEEYHSHWESDEDVEDFSHGIVSKINVWESEEENDYSSSGFHGYNKKQSIVDKQRSLEMPLNLNLNVSRGRNHMETPPPRYKGEPGLFEDFEEKPNYLFSEDSWERGEYLKYKNDLEIKELERARRTLSEERKLLEIEKKKIAEMERRISVGDRYKDDKNYVKEKRPVSIERVSFPKKGDKEEAPKSYGNKAIKDLSEKNKSVILKNKDVIELVDISRDDSIKNRKDLIRKNKKTRDLVEQKPKISVDYKSKASVEKPKASVEKPKALLEEKAKASVEVKPKVLVEEKPIASVKSKHIVSVKEKPIEVKPKTFVEEKPKASIEEKPKLSLEEKPKPSVHVMAEEVIDFKQVVIKQEKIEQITDEQISRKSRWMDNLSSIDLPKTETSLEKTSILEDEYEQFMLAVTSNSPAKKPPSPIQAKRASSSSSSSSDSSNSSDSSSSSSSSSSESASEIPLPSDKPKTTPSTNKGQELTVTTVYGKNLSSFNTEISSTFKDAVEVTPKQSYMETPKNDFIISADSTSSPLKSMTIDLNTSAESVESYIPVIELNTSLESCQGTEIDLENRKPLAAIILPKKLPLDKSALKDFDDSDTETPGKRKLDLEITAKIVKADEGIKKPDIKRESDVKRKLSLSPVRKDKRRANSRERYRKEPSPKRRRSSPGKRNSSPGRSGGTPRRSSRHSPVRSRKRDSSPRRRRDLSSPRRRFSPRRRDHSPSRSDHTIKRDASPRRRRYSRSISKERTIEPIQQTLQRMASSSYDTPSKSPNHSPLDGFKRSLADSTISDDQLLQANQDEYVESPAYHYPSGHLLNPSSRLLVPVVESPKRIPLDDRINQVLGIEKEEEQPKPITTTFGNYGYDRSYYDQYGQQDYEGKEYNQQNLITPTGNNKVITPNCNVELTTKIVQVGNMLQVVPTENVVPVPAKVKSIKKGIDRSQKILQIGNVLEIVPTATLPSEKGKILSLPIPLPGSPPPSIINKEKLSAEDLMKEKIAERKAERETRRLERDKRRKEKEKKQKEREKKKQIKLKQKTEDMIKRALLIEADVNAEPDVEKPAPDTSLSDEKRWPPAPIIISSSRPIGKGILICKTTDIEDTLMRFERKKKGVKFADGIRPGEGTSPSGGEELSSPPPTSSKLPKEKRFTKTQNPKRSKKNAKKKVKVKIIRKPRVDDESDDNLPPPSPPPGSPPPHIYPARIKPAINNVTPTFNTSLPPPSVLQQTNPVNYQFPALGMPPPHHHKPHCGTPLHGIVHDLLHGHSHRPPYHPPPPVVICPPRPPPCLPHGPVHLGSHHHPPHHHIPGISILPNHHHHGHGHGHGPSHGHHHGPSHGHHHHH